MNFKDHGNYLEDFDWIYAPRHILFGMKAWNGQSFHFVNCLLKVADECLCFPEISSKSKEPFESSSSKSVKYFVTLGCSSLLKMAKNSGLLTTWSKSESKSSCVSATQIKGFVGNKNSLNSVLFSDSFLSASAKVHLRLSRLNFRSNFCVTEPRGLCWKRNG